ncbi:MAG: Flp family type IVb pilin [Acidobacteria bacterium]|nr:Flp family type IVb pilin [Acidobacteriota bacterium]
MVRLWTRYQGRFAHDELGVTISQYALIAALIAVVAMAAAVFLGSEISGRFNEVSDTAQSA